MTEGLENQTEVILKTHLNGSVTGIIRAVILDEETTLGDPGIRRGLNELYTIVDRAFWHGYRTGRAEAIDGGVSDDH